MEIKEGKQITEEEVGVLGNKRNNLNEIIYIEKIMWRQRERVTWIKEGDQNTACFHKITNNRRRQNHIKS